MSPEPRGGDEPGAPLKLVTVEPEERAVLRREGRLLSRPKCILRLVHGILQPFRCMRHRQLANYLADLVSFAPGAGPQTRVLLILKRDGGRRFMRPICPEEISAPAACSAPDSPSS